MCSILPKKWLKVSLYKPPQSVALPCRIASKDCRKPAAPRTLKKGLKLKTKTKFKMVTKVVKILNAITNETSLTPKISEEYHTYRVKID